jgi:hypothetical protein
MKKIFLLLTLIILNVQAEHSITIEYLKNHIPKDLSCLELTLEQNTKIHGILITHKENLNKFNNYKKEKEAFIKEYIKNKDFNTEFYFSTKNEIYDKGLAIETNFFEKVFKVLNAEQKKAFLYFLEEWKVE